MSSQPRVLGTIEEVSRCRSCNGLSQSSRSNISDAPLLDRGWRAWSQVLPAFVAFAMTWGYGTGFAAYQLYYQETLHLPSSSVSWIASIQLFLYFVVGMASGRLADAGYTRYLYLFGSMISCFGMFMASLTEEYWQILLAQGICIGLGGGIMFIPAVVNLATNFKHNRMFAMALGACGSSVGAIIFPATVQYLTPQIGFPWAARICAFIALFISILGNLLLQLRETSKSTGPLVDWKAFTNSNFTMFSIASFLTWFSVFTLLLYVNSFAKHQIGVSATESVNFIFISNALALVARPIFGAVADKYLGPINTFGINSLALGIMAFGWIGVRTRAETYVYSGIMGFFNGAAQGVFPGATSSLVDDITKMGTWVGMIYAVCGFATLAGPPTIGAIIDASSGGYMWAQICLGVVIVIGAVSSLITARMVGKRRSQEDVTRRWLYKA